MIINMPSGLCLFAKDFFNAMPQARLVGSLLAAMTEFSIQTTGMPPSYVELSNVALTIVRDDVAHVFCALIHDRDDGVGFGRLIANEILSAFIEEYSGDLRSASGHNLKDFNGFSARIAEVIRNSVRPVLAKLQTAHGVLKAVLVAEDSILQSAGEDQLDQLAVLSNLQATLNFANLALGKAAPGGDRCQHVAVDFSPDARLLLWRIERWAFVVTVHRGAKRPLYVGALEEALVLLQQVSHVLAQIIHNSG